MRAGNSQSDSTVILLLLALFLFHSPFTRWCAGLGLPWYSVFLIWFLLILLVAFNQYWRREDSGSKH